MSLHIIAVIVVYIPLSLPCGHLVVLQLSMKEGLYEEPETLVYRRFFNTLVPRNIKNLTCTMIESNLVVQHVYAYKGNEQLQSYTLSKLYTL